MPLAIDILDPKDNDWRNLLLRQVPIQQQAVERIAAGQKANLPPLEPPEEESLAKRIGMKTLGGLGYVGGLLDKFTAGRAVRGLLGGKPRELLSVLPGSDITGLTNEAEAVTGRDLAERWGWTRPGEEGFVPFMKGMAADIITSPATYVTGPLGATTKAGELAAKIGIKPGLIQGMKGLSKERLAEQAFKGAGLSEAEMGTELAARAAKVGINLEDIADQPLRGVAKIGVPFMPKATLGASPEMAGRLETLGRGARAVAEHPGIKIGPVSIGPATFTHPIEKAWSAVSAPAARHLRALFNWRYANATTQPGQEAGLQYTTGVTRALDAAREEQAAVVTQLHDAGLLDRPDMFRALAEGTASATGPEGAQIQRAVELYKSYFDRLQQEGAVIGFAPKTLQDEFIEHFPRFKAELAKPTKGYEKAGGGARGRLFQTVPAALHGREEILKNIPGGTVGDPTQVGAGGLNLLSMDPDVSGILGRYGPAMGRAAGKAPTTPLEREAIVRGRYLGVTPQMEAEIGPTLALRNAGMKLSEAEELLLSRVEQSKGLTRWAENLDPQYALSQTPFFGNHPLDDALRYAAAMIRRNEAGKAIQTVFRNTAMPTAEAGPNMVRLSSAFARAGFDDTTAALKHFAERKGFAAGTPEYATVGHEMWIPENVVQDATRFHAGFQTPAVLQPLVDVVDQFTNITKGFQTAPWPGFHFRNFVSGQWANMMINAFDPRNITAALKIMQGKIVEGISKLPVFKGMGLTDEQATREFAKLAYANRVAGQKTSLVGETVGGPERQALSLRQKIPGLEPVFTPRTPGEGVLSHLWQRAKANFPQTKAEWNPFNVSGVSANEDLFWPIRAGRFVGDATEEVNRMGGFLTKLQQGFDPQTAATMIRGAHVDYSALSDFEKNVMRRLVPFYTYTRGIVPFALENILTHPGGIGGQTAMAAYHIRQQEKGFIPQYLGQNLAIPIGKEQDGTQRFFTRFDEPVSAAAQLIHGGGLGANLMGLLGQTNPLLKGPLELATGKQFFTGRDLADLYPLTGANWMDQLLMNSPLSRLATTYRQLTDPRKWQDPYALPINLLTGFKLSDVDMERQRALAEREYIGEALRGQPGIKRYETIYARPEQLGQLTPQDIALLRLNKTLELRAQEAARAKQKIGVNR